MYLLMLFYAYEEKKEIIKIGHGDFSEERTNFIFIMVFEFKYTSMQKKISIYLNLKI